MEPTNYRAQGLTIGTSLSGGSNVARIDPPPESPSAIRDAITYGEDVLGQLHATISHLESRLDTALTPNPPQPAAPSSGNAPTPIMSNVRGRLGALNAGISDAVTRLSYLRDRIEI